MKAPTVFRGLRAQLLATYLALIVLSLGVVVWRVGTWLDDSRFAETRRDQEGRAILAASATEELLEKLELGQIDQDTFRVDILSLSLEMSQPLMVLGVDRQVLADTDDPQKTQLDTANPEIAAAYGGKIGQDVRYDSDERRESMFTAAAIRHDKDLIGIVQIELPISAVRATSQRTWTMLAGAALLAAAATVLASLLFARSVVGPIAELERAATMMAAGDLKRRIRVRGPAEIQKLARGLDFMAERLSALLEDQRAFTASAAHELRTPLTTIRLRVEALREGAKDDPHLAEQFLADIDAESERLARLVAELLALSRIETELIEPRREPVSVKDVATAAADDLREKAVKAGLDLRVSIASGLPMVQANPDEIRRVFVNLIENAIKFTPPGGSVSVRASHGNNRLTKEEWVVSEVCDTGVGIPSEDLPHIFDRFYRSDKARTRDTGGAGLGLAIVRGIVVAHGGRVWAQSERDKGTTISFTLPLR